MNRAVILAGARTAFGKFGGSLSAVHASDLGATAIKGALEKSNVRLDEVDEVILGSVLQGGQGQIPSRQAAIKANLPIGVKTETINKVCASGMRAVTLADQLIRLGDEEVIVAGGMESMSNAPYYLLNGRTGLRMGDSTMVDGMLYDGLTCAFDPARPHMGSYGNSTAKEFSLSREEQDAWSVRSHERALAAMDKGYFAEEIVPVEIPQRKGEPLVVIKDEAPRPGTSLEILAKLKPAFDKDGTITAGNAPGVNDGACALVMMNEERAIREGREPLAIIIGHEELAIEPENFPQTPGLVINKLLKKTNKSLADIDLFEINEAFAAVALVSKQLADLDAEKVNVNGGAVALGHPIGASGARIILTLAQELKRRGGGIGIAAICSGGGQGDAIMIEVPKTGGLN
ncbi:acetyl-CoA C-acetyltransferase [Lysinibacillus sp. fkY74-1]|uniref:acetyl-CoA C-acetyltransferase n=1 Tax=Lysinibacillus pinottii TaxID=2973932 RepID=A0ABT2DPP3_9BACI|nr:MULTISPECIES: acetyl-CoA C-acetyltransferase [Lysinibacillus]MBE5081989.1 acetyl-CoA C-acetyltransferase [Bacillus thuringiensis]AMO31143.1 acetyl-CoA acetyltransferase [Lysinibacillus sphaericus]AMR89750.1 acetyl-CoA acetyltransferase [Lysinibacillus sphaericus]ANA47821.1 acetyl-CoA acetyltransferase [Lysinibacillus sphaericus]KZL47233.1 acetyl-CoA acetyltransferase [Lysinibacillus sphaericus]